MKRLATFAWRSPPPTSVDELLAIFDDGTAWLVLRRPRTGTGPIGTFRTKPVAADLAALTAAGPGPIAFDVLDPPRDPATAALRTAAERVAAAAQKTPRATATFHAGPSGPVSGGRLAMALLVVGAGKKAVEFELDPGRCTVHFNAGGQPIAWFPMPELGSGFVTPDAEGLGGLRMPAKVPPGDYGATAFDLAAPGNATTVSIHVEGSLSEALPDEPMPAPFAVSTDAAPIPGTAAAAEPA